MIPEEVIQNLVLTHGVSGSLGLLTGLMAIVSKKGSRLHVISGKLFFYTMLIAAATALFVSVQPNHESPFLFVIGLFSSYFILSGYRAIRFKDKLPNVVDYCISIGMILTGLFMIVYPVIVSGNLNIVLGIFGGTGLIFSIQDLFVFRNREKLKKAWLQIHLGKMMGAYISAVTAFIVVNQILPGVYGWIAPGVVGGVLITIWSNKYKVKN